MGKHYIGLQADRFFVGLFKKIARLVGRLESGPRLVADRADEVPANRVGWPCGPADTADVVFTHVHRKLSIIQTILFHTMKLATMKVPTLV